MRRLSDIVEFPKFAVFDVEAEKWVDVLCICHVDEDKNRKHFASAAEYVTWLFDEWDGTHVWAHWGGHYDHRFILHEIHTRALYFESIGQARVDFEIVLSGNLIVILVVTMNGRTIRFCESARIMPDSVENIGKAIGLHKLDVDRTAIARPTTDAEWEELRTYCFRDCDIVLGALCTIRAELKREGIDFAYTLASMATRLIRRSDILNFREFYEDDLERPGKSKQRREFWDADHFSCAAYFGGRTEVFAGVGLGKINGPFWIYDIRSSYPASMTCEVPAYFKEFRAGPLDGVTKRTQLTTCGITQAIVTIPEGSMPIPLLPLRVTRTEQQIIEGKAKAEGRCVMCGKPNPVVSDKDDNWLCELCFKDPVPMAGGKIYYIEGHMEGRWTNLELLTLYDHMRDVPGFDIKIRCQALYRPLAFMKPFVEKFWKLRVLAIEQGEKAKAAGDEDARIGAEFKKYVYKILMNAVSGKLAEQVTKTKVIYGKAVLEAKRDKLNKCKPTAVPGIWTVEQQSEGAFRHAAAAAYVTGRSRVWLWTALMAAYKAGARVMYCDTDSIIVDQPIFGEEKRTGIGEWNLEHKIKWIEIWAPKVYRYEDEDGGMHYKAKGMPIERRENKGDPRAREELWNDYTARFQDAAEVAGDNLGYYPRDKATKETVRGLLTDLNTKEYDRAGNLRPDLASARPRAFALKRELVNTDKKRRHSGGTSTPLYQERVHGKRKLSRVSAQSKARTESEHCRSSGDVRTVEAISVRPRARAQKAEG